MVVSSLLGACVNCEVLNIFPQILWNKVMRKAFSVMILKVLKGQVDYLITENFMQCQDADMSML